MKRLKAIVCFFRRCHKYDYYTSECVTCGKKRKHKYDKISEA